MERNSVKTHSIEALSQNVKVSVLVISYGSIGKRHASVLMDLDCEVSLVTSQQVSEYCCYSSIQQALEEKSFSYVVVASPTYLHHTHLFELAACGYKGTLLVEKPLYDKLDVSTLDAQNQILIAYNLRFHELLRFAQELLTNEELIFFSAQVGQYLPTWRTNQDYKKSYSAKKNCGGGVLRDLSHELDYIIWLCGNCLELTSRGGKYSELEIDSDDIYSIIMSCERCPIVSLQLDYLARVPKREIMIQTKKHTIFINLMNGTLVVDGEIKYKTSNKLDYTYIKQHEAALSGKFNYFCTYEQGLYIVKLIDVIEQANISKNWISL